MQLKRAGAAAAALILAGIMTACGGTPGTEPVYGGSGADAQRPIVYGSSEFPETAAGTTYGVGRFRVYVPKGWEAVPLPDETDPKLPAEDVILLVRGAEFDKESGTWNTEGCPSVRIRYFSKADKQRAKADERAYAHVEDVEARQVGKHVWDGFTIHTEGAPVAVLWTIEKNYGYRLEADFSHGINMADPDLQKIMESLA